MLNFEIEQILRYTNRIKEELEKYEHQICKAQQVKIITYSGKVYSNLNSYLKNHSFYHRNELCKNDVDNIVTNAHKHYNELLKKIEEIHEENKSALENNKNGRKNVVNFMNQMGISKSYDTYKYKTSRSKNKTKISHFAGFISDIERIFIINDFYETEKMNLEKFKQKIEKFKKDEYEKIDKITKQKEIEDKKLRMLASALQYVKDNNITTEYKTNEELLDIVNDHASEKYIEKNYPDGIEVNIKCCSECSSWIVGEHRCSCGNRRISLNVEGNFFDGFFIYPEAY